MIYETGFHKDTQSRHSKNKIEKETTSDTKIQWIKSGINAYLLFYAFLTNSHTISICTLSVHGTHTFVIVEVETSENTCNTLVPVHSMKQKVLFSPREFMLSDGVWYNQNTTATFHRITLNFDWVL